MRIRVTLAAALLLCSVLAAQAVRLTYKDPLGATRTYQMSMTMQGGEVDIPKSGKMPMINTIKMDLVEKAIGGQNDLAQIDLVIKGGSMTVKAGTVSQTVNVPTNEITFLRSRLGKTSDYVVKGGENAAQLNSSTEMFKQFNSGFEFPDEDLPVGKVWTQTQSVKASNGGTVEMTGKHALLGTKVVDGVTYQVISSTYAMSMPLTPVGNKTNRLNMQIAMTFNGAATTLFNADAGELFRTTLKGDMSMSMTMTGPDGNDINSTTAFNMNMSMAKVGATTIATDLGPNAGTPWK